MPTAQTRLHTEPLPPLPAPPPAPRRPRAAATAAQPLRGVRVLSLALNVPGPAAVMRLVQWGARCTHISPPTGDPMRHYSPTGHAQMHQGVRSLALDLKTVQGQKALHTHLARTDVLITSFRPAALPKLGLHWAAFERQYPALSWVQVVGAPGAAGNEAGHDLTYQASAGLLPHAQLPTSLFADMGGALMVSEAVLRALWVARNSGKGVRTQVALSDAAAWMALPRAWGMTGAGDVLGGAHAGYRVYACQDGQVALAALEPHFAQRLCAAAGLPHDARDLQQPTAHAAIAAFVAAHTCQSLNALAAAQDIPLLAMPHTSTSMTAAAAAPNPSSFAASPP